MNTLFLDLASHIGLLACATEGGVTAAKEVDQRVSDAEFLLLLEGLLREVQWGVQDVERIACVVGPGGFTSIRVAVAFTNALAFALNVPVAGIHLSDLWAARVSLEDALWLHSTKKNEIFIRGFGTFAKIFPGATWKELSQLEGKIPQGAPWVGELLPDHERLLSSWGAARAEAKEVKEILPTFLTSLNYEEKNLAPWYGRKW